ncbi:MULTISPECIES: HAD family hydrolase [unclassified Ruegeria]|uniref:HAD family hydrolase n=1 Tax=unclassified Ruegeria TaxID=2625375 RepID=UPI0014918F1C|nr:MULTISPECIES: HAD family hydrolase [unclassified Ruegeria]NOD48436.1 HAD-IA family hydrolase [Ruegeria sp. HKCCD5849]NOD52456.1 HAD-IA family hydrolase [Ruegeria sp. HKCCD5851]NOD68559.1 HAD-IA family hydrolase [Ruegeria sp. HKCCD7303]
MPIDAIVFDKDGTLFDFANTWGGFGRSLLLRLTDGDKERAAGLGRLIGYDLEQERYAEDSIVIAATVEEIADVLAAHVDTMTVQEIVDVMNAEAAAAPQSPAVPLVPFLEGLHKAGLKLGVATNDSEHPAMQHLESAGISEHFDFIAGYDSGHGFKPGPGQLLAFAAHVGVDPSRVAMVGDSLHDLQAGRAAGMTTIGVLTGLAEAEVLAPMADVVLPDIGHIPEWLVKNQLG